MKFSYLIILLLSNGEWDSIGDYQMKRFIQINGYPEDDNATVVKLIRFALFYTILFNKLPI